MSILNKILEEIEERLNMVENIPINEDDDFLDGEECYETGRVQGRFEELLWCRNFIRSHMGEVLNNWIPVEDGLPEEGEEVEVTIEEMADSAGGMIYYTKTAWVQEERWVIKRNPYNPRVIAWRPLPKPYKPENRNNNTTKEYQQEVEHLLEEIKSENGYVRVSDLAKRFEKIDHELFKDSSWNLLQILSNINILIPKHFD